jgi:hypothetical protein
MVKMVRILQYVREDAFTRMMKELYLTGRDV